MSDINTILNYKPNLFIVDCKKIIRDSKEITQYKINTSYNPNISSEKLLLTETQKEELIKLFSTNSRQFIYKLINYYLENEKIIEYNNGRKYLLPKKYQRYHEKCITFSTGKYQIFFNDLAKYKCKDIIYKLNERSKIDSFNFVKGKLESRETCNLELSINEGDFIKRGRIALLGEKNSSMGPKNFVSYSADIPEIGLLDEDDVKNILNLIEEFVKVYGTFKYVENTNKELIAHNQGSIKIMGIDKDERIKQKVYQLFKEES